MLSVLHTNLLKKPKYAYTYLVLSVYISNWWKSFFKLQIILSYMYMYLLTCIWLFSCNNILSKEKYHVQFNITQYKRKLYVDIKKTLITQYSTVSCTVRWDLTQSQWVKSPSNWYQCIYFYTFTQFSSSFSMKSGYFVIHFVILSVFLIYTCILDCTLERKMTPRFWKVFSKKIFFILMFSCTEVHTISFNHLSHWVSVKQAIHNIPSYT